MIRKNKLKKGVSYTVFYRGANGKQFEKTFKLKKDATAFEDEQRRRKRMGDFIDPSLGKTTLKDIWSGYYRSTEHLSVKTRDGYRSAYECHIEPAFGNVELKKITYEDAEAFIRKIEQKYPVQAQRVYRVFKLILDYAVQRKLIGSNRIVGIKFAKAKKKQYTFLGVEQVIQLANLFERLIDKVLVLIMALCGLRWSEASGLRVKAVDLVNKRLYITERVVEVRGILHVGNTKSNASTRVVAIPAVLIPLLAELLKGKNPDDYVFTSVKGKILRNDKWREQVNWDQKVAVIGVPDLKIHDLRRSYGSIARANGADLKNIQMALGHASVTVTADIYSHLFDDEVQAVASSISEAFEGQL